MSSEPGTTDISYVEQFKHIDGKVSIIERWVPAKAGDFAPFLFRLPGQDKFIPMKLESRRIVDA